MAGPYRAASRKVPAPREIATGLGLGLTVCHAFLLVQSIFLWYERDECQREYKIAISRTNVVFFFLSLSLHVWSGWNDMARLARVLQISRRRILQEVQCRTCCKSEKLRFIPPPELFYKSTILSMHWRSWSNIVAVFLPSEYMFRMRYNPAMLFQDHDQ